MRNGTRSIAERAVALARRVTPGHRGQGSVLFGLLLLAILMRSPGMVLSIPGYLLMHLCYGGGEDKSPHPGGTGTRDPLAILVVAVGMLSMATYVGAAVFRLVEICSGWFR